MTVFRRIEELHENQSFQGEYTTYDAFFYQGPFTDYPSWAQYAFQNRDMKAPNAHALLVVLGERKYPDLEMHTPNYPVENGSWVMKVYRHKSEHNYSLELKVYTTEQMRMEFYPTGELTTDEAAEYFVFSDLSEDSLVLSVPVRFSSFQWKGVAHATPWWLQQAITHGRIILKGASLYHMCDVARPGDWVLFSHGPSGSVRMMSDAEYQKVKM